MTAAEFWKQENSHWAAHSERSFSCMTSWTVGMFNVVMAFAEAYAEHRLTMAIKCANDLPQALHRE